MHFRSYNRGYPQTQPSSNLEVLAACRFGLFVCVWGYAMICWFMSCFNLSSVSV